MLDPLIHIGYHKTASSWLQQSVFPNAPGLCYVAGPHEQRNPIRQIFVEGNSFSYDADKIRSFIEPRFAGCDGRTPVISFERFSGNPYSGGHDSSFTARRLRELFPGARILVVIREQADMLLSIYKQYIQAGGGASFSQFLEPRTGAGSISSFRFDYLEYHRLISFYQSLFSPERVLVLPYELLKREPVTFLKRIGEFSEADPGMPDPARRKPSLSAAALYAARHGNRLFALTGLNPAPVFPINDGFKRVKKLSKRLNHSLPDAIKRRADERWSGYAKSITSNIYSRSNTITSRITGLDLVSFGYECFQDVEDG